MGTTPLAPSVLEALRGFDSPTLSSAIETFGVRDRLTGFAGYRVRCLFPELGTTLGYAVTAQVDRTSPSPSVARAPLRELAQLVEASPKQSCSSSRTSGRDRGTRRSSALMAWRSCSAWAPSRSSVTRRSRA